VAETEKGKTRSHPKKKWRSVQPTNHKILNKTGRRESRNFGGEGGKTRRKKKTSSGCGMKNVPKESRRKVFANRSGTVTEKGEGGLVVRGGGKF